MRILHSDDALIAVEKPAGMLAVPGRGADKQDCLSTRVQASFEDARIVHRLDMATSGLMLLARGSEAQRKLGNALARREIAKRYVAVVEGLVKPDTGQIDLALSGDWPNRPRQRVDPLTGKAALTRFRVLSRDAGADTTRLELEPVSGRTHQLRVHLTAIGHRIVGDLLYGGRAHPRLLLHACAIGLMHPTAGHPLSLESEVPF
jgi:tRNA pseudouridine32 synthase/23S rRNA pseudouridine746 synthase